MNYLVLLFEMYVPFLREIYALSTITFMEEITPSHIVTAVKQNVMQEFNEEKPIAEIIGLHVFLDLQIR